MSSFHEAERLSPPEAFARFQEPHAVAARIKFCGKVASALQNSGRVLWAFGLAHDLPAREALAIVTQMAGDLAQGAVDLYSRENWYGGASLVRQLVETEYLLFLFAESALEAERWRNSTSEERKGFFTPAKMRKRSGGRFRSSEYAAHCERGGHPTPYGEMFLAEHTTRFGSNLWLWSDLAQHLERLWSSFDAAVAKLNLADIQTVAAARAEFQVWLAELVANDSAYRWFDLSGVRNEG